MQLLSGDQVQELYANFEQDCQDGHLLHIPVKDQHVISAELMIKSLPNVMAQAANLIEIKVEWFGHRDQLR